MLDCERLPELVVLVEVLAPVWEVVELVFGRSMTEEEAVGMENELELEVGTRLVLLRVV